MPLKPARSFRIVLAFAASSSPTIAFSAHADDKQACVDASTEGQSLRDAHKLHDAHDRFTTCAREACPAIVRKYCADWLADVDHRLPTVVFRVRSSEGADVAGATLTVDGKGQTLDASTPVALDPGAHSVHASSPNGEEIDEKVMLVEGEQGRVVVLRFPASSGTSSGGALPPPPKDTTTESSSGGFTPLTTVSLVVGGLGVAGFAYFGLKARGDLSNLRDTCAPYCASSDLTTVKTEALAADIALGVGVVALGIAAYSFFSHHDVPAAASLVEVHPRIGGASIDFGSAF
jgi:hypothetical protein